MVGKRSDVELASAQQNLPWQGIENAGQQTR
jgi:hypothetical protein